MRALEAALNAVWAMEEGALQTLLSIAARENDITPEAIEAYRAKTLDRAEQARVRDGVAIIDITGATFKRANLFTAMSGATSYDIIRADFQAALDDPKVKAVMFNIDSPGGEASGATELSAAIYGARGRKPIAAYVNGMGASAAYNIASAVDPGRLYVASDALLGSIGVQMAIKGDPPANDKAAPTYRFVSAQSPMKNADPGTEAGAQSIQTVVNAMAQVFVENVARNRGVDIQTVLNDFGKGGIFVGKDAVKAGLADELGSFESVLAELAGTRKTAAKGGRDTRKQGISMSENAAETANETKVDVAAEVAKAVAANNARIVGINKIAAAHGIAADKVNDAIALGTTVADFALAAADHVVAAKAAAEAAEASKKDAAVAALKADEATASSVAPSNGTEPSENDEIAALAKAIVGNGN